MWEYVLYVGEKPATALETLSFGRKSLKLMLHLFLVLRTHAGKQYPPYVHHHSSRFQRWLWFMETWSTHRVYRSTTSADGFMSCSFKIIQTWHDDIQKSKKKSESQKGCWRRRRWGIQWVYLPNWVAFSNQRMPLRVLIPPTRIGPSAPI